VIETENYLEELQGYSLSFLVKINGKTILYISRLESNSFARQFVRETVN